MPLFITLKEIFYDGENVGRDMELTFKVAGQSILIKKRLKHKTTTKFSKTLFELDDPAPSRNYQLKITGREKDTKPIYDDKAEGKIDLSLSADRSSQNFSGLVTVVGDPKGDTKMGVPKKAKLNVTVLVSFTKEGQEGQPEGEFIDDKKEKRCGAKFVSKRQVRSFYTAKKFGTKFGEPVACNKPKTINLPEKISIPIYWVVLGDKWKEAQAKAKMDEAKAWFNKYCISLTIYKVNLKGNDAKTFGADLAKANGVSPGKYAQEIGKVYKRLWVERMGKPGKFLLVMFVNAFKKVVYEKRAVSTAGNFQKAPIILIPEPPDTKSRNIVSHELVHGLGKVKWGKGTPPSTVAFQDRRNTWDEGACAEEMGNSAPARANGAAVFRKPNNATMDWASYIQFLTSKTIY